MKKFVIATIAILDGLLLAFTTTAVILGFIYATTISAEYLLLVLTPAPAFFIHRAAYRFCDKLQSLDK